MKGVFAIVELPKKVNDAERDCQFDEAFALLGDLFDSTEADKRFPDKDMEFINLPVLPLAA